MSEQPARALVTATQLFNLPKQRRKAPLGQRLPAQGGQVPCWGRSFSQILVLFSVFPDYIGSRLLALSMRSPRYVPQGGGLFEITVRTQQGRFLLKPSRQLNEGILGILARAQKRTLAEVHAFAFLSNHFHLLLSVENAQQMADFMREVNGPISKLVRELYGWSGGIWSSRYRAIPVSDEPEAQLARMRYILAHGVKEGLVHSPLQWPGVHAAKYLVSGELVKGSWVDRTRYCQDRRQKRNQGKKLDLGKYTESHVFALAPLPCVSHLSPEVYRRLMQEMVATVEAEGTSRMRGGFRFLGAKKVLAQRPTHRPSRLEWSPAPRLHCFAREIRRRWMEAFAWFMEAYREASKALRSGDRGVQFPEGCFPPSLPFVPFAEVGPIR